jgi:hypothetical protein
MITPMIPTLIICRIAFNDISFTFIAMHSKIPDALFGINQCKQSGREKVAQKAGALF